MVQIAVVDFLTPATADSADLDVTSSEITETFEAAILFYSHHSTADTNFAHGVIGMGLISVEGDSGGANEYCRTTVLRDALTTSTQGFHTNSTSACIISAADAVTTDCQATFSSVQPGGMRLNFSVHTNQIRCTAILFAGLGRSSLGTAVSTTGASAHEDVGNAGVGLFQPDLIITAGADGSLAIGSDDCTPNIGFAIRDPLTQITSYINIARGSDPTYADGFIRTDSCASAFQTQATNPPVNSVERVVLSSFDSTGFNHQATGNQHAFLYLAIKWSDTLRVRTALANMPIAAATGQQAFNSFGFTPDVVVGMSTMMTSLDAQTGDGVAQCGAGYFVTGRHGSHAYSLHHDHDVVIVGNPTDTNSRNGAHAIITLNDGAAVAQQADWVGGSSSGGFVLNFTTASQAGYMTALGIQLNPSPVRQLRRRRQSRRVRTKAKIRPQVHGAQAGAGATLVRLLKVVARFRKAMQRRFRRAYEPPHGAAVFSDEVAEPAGSVFSSGSQRGTVSSGAVAEGSVF